MATKKHLHFTLSHPWLSEAIFCDSPSILKVQILAWHSLCKLFVFSGIIVFKAFRFWITLHCTERASWNVGRWAKWDPNKLVNAWPSSGLKPLSLRCLLEDRSTKPTLCLGGLVCCAEAQVVAQLNQEDLLPWRSSPVAPYGTQTPKFIWLCWPMIIDTRRMSSVMIMKAVVLRSK